MIDYTPNFNDPRVVKRVNSAIGFTNALLSDSPKQLYTRFIDKHFGASSHKLSKYLRSHLLICIDTHYDMKNGLCKMYIRNKRGLNYLSDMIQYNTSEHTSESATQYQKGLNWATLTYKQQIASGDFEYSERSHRLCSPIQGIRTTLREDLFNNAGYSYNYDISTAAPTLMYQHYMQCADYCGLVLETIEDYIANKSERRAELCKGANLEADVVKKIFNGLFNGAKLSIHYNTQLFKLIGCDVAKMRYLQQHEYLTALKADIKTMWDTIRSGLPKQYYTDRFNKNGSPRARQFNSKQKWNIYFQLERKVLNEMRDYLKTLRCRFFLEHDGFRCTTKINTVDISQWIEAGTGFKLTLTEKCYTSSIIA
tara:strand:- start:127 stop:1227 length:1101 start_codon:yes stop_codon:yes gene_type:complete